VAQALPVAVVYGAPMYAREGEVPSEFMARIKAEIERMLAEHGPRVLGAENPYDSPEGDKK
jgi:vancomycin permeability regulator SanA